MSYLNPPYHNNFQELCAAMPLFYLDVLEMRSILRVQGHALDGLCDSVGKLVDANFILTADEATIRLWEKALEITYNSRLTLEQRRRVVIGYIIGLGHIGEKEIRGIIRQYTDGEVTVEFNRGVITVVVYGEIFDKDMLLVTLLKRIPAHLSLILEVVMCTKSPSILHIGGVFGTQMTLPIPEAPDEMKWLDTLRAGGSAAVLSVLPVPERA